MKVLYCINPNFVKKTFSKAVAKAGLPSRLSADTFSRSAFAKSLLKAEAQKFSPKVSALNTPFYSAASKMKIQRRVVLENVAPEELNLKKLCKLLLPEGKDFYIDEKFCLQLASSQDAAVAAAEAKQKFMTASAQQTLDVISEIFKKHGLETPLRLDCEKSLSQVHNLKTQYNLEGEELERFQNALTELWDSISAIRFMKEKSKKISEEGLKCGFKTLREARAAAGVNFSDLTVNNKNKLLMLDYSRAGKTSAKPLILSPKDFSEYLDLVQQYDFIDKNLNASVKTKDGQRVLSFEKFGESSYQAVHSMHRLIDRFGLQNDGSIDFSALKKMLDRIQSAFDDFKVNPDKMPTLWNDNPVAGLFIAPGKTTRGNISLLFPNEKQDDFIDVILDRDGKLVTVINERKEEVYRKFVPYTLSESANKAK